MGAECGRHPWIYQKKFADDYDTMVVIGLLRAASKGNWQTALKILSVELFAYNLFVLGFFCSKVVIDPRCNTT